MAIELKKVQNVETLALGFNYEASIDLSTLGTTAGSATAVDIQVGGAAMAGGVFGAAIIVDELVVGTSITDATIAIGDDGDADGFVDEVDVFSDSGNLGKMFANTGALAVAGFHLASAVDLTYNFTGEGPDVATAGKIRLLMKYYPTAGQLFAS